MQVTITSFVEKRTANLQGVLQNISCRRELREYLVVPIGTVDKVKNNPCVIIPYQVSGVRPVIETVFAVMKQIVAFIQDSVASAKVAVLAAEICLTSMAFK